MNKYTHYFHKKNQNQDQCQCDMIFHLDIFKINFNNNHELGKQIA